MMEDAVNEVLRKTANLRTTSISSSQATLGSDYHLQLHGVAVPHSVSGHVLGLFSDSTVFGSRSDADRWRLRVQGGCGDVEPQ